ncbi:MAG: hypothetical protein MI717_09720 [Spirochaetales bacterium]|nr:hypothetical protein [Spirochaetales bacterium]
MNIRNILIEIPWFIYAFLGLGAYALVHLIERKEKPHRQATITIFDDGPKQGDSEIQAESLESEKHLNALNANIHSEYSEVKKLYASVIPHHELEKKTLQKTLKGAYSRIFLVFGVLFSFALLISTNFFFKLNHQETMFLIIVFFACMIFLMILGSLRWKNLLIRVAQNSSQQETVAHQVTEQLFPGFSYSHQTNIPPLRPFKGGHSFSLKDLQSPPHSYGVVHGQFGIHQLEIYDIGLKKRKSSNFINKILKKSFPSYFPQDLFDFVSNKHHLEDSSFFRGLFCQVQVDRHKGNWILIHSNLTKKWQSFFLDCDDEKRIHHPLLEPSMTIFGKNKIESKKILNPPVEFLLLEFSKQLAQPFMISIMDGYLNLVVEQNNGLLPLTAKSQDDSIEGFIKVMLFLLRITHAISCQRNPKTETKSI